MGLEYNLYFCSRKKVLPPRTGVDDIKLLYMGIRVNRLLTELNIGLPALENMLNVLGYKEQNLTVNTKLSDETAMLVRELYSDDGDFLSLIKFAAKNGVYGSQNDSTPTLNIIGRIDLDEYKNWF